VPHIENCEGLLGYMFIPDGDGLPTSYYNNEKFEGTPVKKFVSSIDFDWQNDSPTEGINYENYAITFEGYLRSPFTALYTFTTFADDGA